MSRPGAPAYSGSSRPDLPWSREIRRYSPAATEDTRSEASEDGEQPQSSGGKYRTLCVRTCDGYYFPIGNAVSRQRFMRDAAQCRASCGEEARLFYLPSGSDNVSTMIDLAGRSYVRMPAAFKYRKSLTDGCTCRPMPWSAAEQQRHQQYAADAARAAAEAESKRLAAEAAEVARIAAADKPNGAAKPKPGKAGDRIAGVASATVASKLAPTSDSAAPPDRAETGQASHDPQTAPAADADATVVSDADQRKLSARADRNRQGAAPRGADRGMAARRQHAVARATPSQSGGTTWFSPSSAKYTWPGDAPKR